MNRRHLILGGALGLAAGASAQAQPRAPKAPKPSGGPGEPGGIYIPSHYGQVIEIQFTTSTDLNAFMPPGLAAIDPHRAFIKAERLKLRSPDADKTTAAFTQYDQICITTMATTPQFGARHRNILMWEDRVWMIEGKEQGVKRWGDVQMTQIYEIDYELVAQGGSVPFAVNVWQNNNPLMNFIGQFDGKKRIEHEPHPGSYVGGDPGQDLLTTTLEAAEYSRPLHGTGTLRFGGLPNMLSDRKVAPGGTAPFDTSGPPGPGKSWSPALLKDIEVQGAVLRNFSFTESAAFQTVRKALPGNGRSRL